MKKLIATFALCLFAAGASRGQNYSDMLYRDWAGLRAFAQVNRNLTVEPEVVFMGNSITEGKFHPARAERRRPDPTVLYVSAYAVGEPKYVRYNFKNCSIGHLWDAFGQPVIPFRTDDFDE